ncbi:recombinase family protein [Rhodococcus globerulus]|uniref:recombinase family protein n=1 Tax=Rhodococcus globerulus TaxID=33008 RepID=UPI00068D10CF|nr:recombinase family protein [Rhodococcus globerulus]PVX59721.1 resolvase-like protein [Rhodococcus globerulus]
MLFGYARVSSAEQNPAHQIDALVRAGLDAENIHTDRASGAKASRPQLDVVMQRLRSGDTLVITRLDRLGRSVLHLITLGAQLRERGIGLKVLDAARGVEGVADDAGKRTGATLGCARGADMSDAATVRALTKIL